MLFQLNGLRKYFLVFSKTVKHNYPHAVGPVHCADVMIIYSLLSLCLTHTQIILERCGRNSKHGPKMAEYSTQIPFLGHHLETWLGAVEPHNDREASGNPLCEGGRGRAGTWLAADTPARAERRLSHEAADALGKTWRPTAALLKIQTLLLFRCL